MSPGRRAGRLRTAIVRSNALRVGPVLVVAAIAGYVVGGCAGDGSSGLPGLSGVTDLPSGSLPTLPIRTETEPETTEEAPTTLPEPTTTEEAPTVPSTPTTTTTETETEPTTSTAPPTTSSGGVDTTTTEESDDDGIWGWVALGLAVAADGTTETDLSTTTDAATTTTAETETRPTETVAPEPTSSESSTPWGWIALALGAVAAGVVGLLVWRRRRGRDSAL